MALTTCPECGSRVGERARSCPKCGYPLNNAARPQNPLVGLPPTKALPSGDEEPRGEETIEPATVTTNGDATSVSPVQSKKKTGTWRYYIWIPLVVYLAAILIVPPSDAQLREKIVGSWRAQDPKSGAAFRFTFMPGGQMEVSSEGWFGSTVLGEMQLLGKWSINNARVTIEITSGVGLLTKIAGMRILGGPIGRTETSSLSFRGSTMTIGEDRFERVP